MEQKHFTLFEPGKDNNIGTISVSTDEELNQKIGHSCASHFDAQVTIKDQTLEDIISDLNKHPYTTFWVNIDAGEPLTCEIAIQQTWIY
jgi:sulfatase maturation enzyme AslB (radical SAM superfamily)